MVQMTSRLVRVRFLFPVLALGLLVGCEMGGPPKVPTADQATAYYGRDDVEASVDGNVVTITVAQRRDYLRRGGSLWARSTPYIFLFSTATNAMFQENEDLGAVRVVTRLPDGEEVARVLLRRNALNGITWGHALQASSKAVKEGTQNPRTLRELVDFGEKLVEFHYNEKY